MSSSESVTDTESPVASSQTQLDWWHRDHPVFTALMGFFAGMLAVTAVPGGFAALLRLLLDDELASDLFWLVAVVLLVPLVLLWPLRTRRFAKYMLFGMLLTGLVVLGVASLVLYVLVRFHG